MADSDVGRNKLARRQQGRAFPATLELRDAGRTRGQAYSGLLQDVYNDKRWSVEMIKIFQFIPHPPTDTPRPLRSASNAAE